MNDIPGWFAYKHTTTMQHEDAVDKFRELLKQTKPSQILEIGTAQGGLTLALLDLLAECDLPNTTLRTYDIHERNLHELVETIENGANGEIFVKNIFNDNYDALEEVEEIQSYIQRPGCTLVLCDGGSKIREFNILSPYLKEGDIIMAHDYAPNEQYFLEYNKDKVWNWLEIQDCDITEAVKLHNLEPFMQDEFIKVVWVCKIKK